MRGPRMSKSKKVLVQLRLNEDEAQELRKAGETQGRKLPAEIMQRLRASLMGAEFEIDQALYGWSKESLTHNRALGQMLGYLAARLERLFGQPEDEDHQRGRATQLARLKEAALVLLDRLGGKDEYLTSDDGLAAHSIAIVLARDLSKALQSGDPTAHQFPEAAALARIARGLDLPRAELAKLSSTDE